MSTTTKQILIIYNADSSLRGTIGYVCRKIGGKKEDGPACAACEITHGGLSLNEVPNWKKAKEEIESRGWSAVQWHRDEVEPAVKKWIESNSVLYPVALAREDGDLRVVADKGELASCGGEAQKFVSMLQDKKVL